MTEEPSTGGEEAVAASGGGTAEAPGPAAPAGQPDYARTLRHSIQDGCYHAAMLGAAEAYFAPFAIFLGAGATGIALLASVPLFLGSLAQVVAVRVLSRASSRRRLVVLPATLQAVSLLPMALLPAFVPGYGAELLIAGAAVYFCCGNFGMPPWSSWMGDLVAPNDRGSYFGRRDRLRTFCQVAAIAATGGTLALARGAGHELYGFVAVFVAAALARVASAWHLARMDEPAFTPPQPEDQFSFGDFVRRMPRSNFGRFAALVAAVQMGVSIAGPFFSLYMLRDLGFSYAQFMAASTSTILAQALMFHNWGRLADRFGNVTVLRITGVLVPIVPLLWLVSASFGAVLVWQTVSGFVWAGFLLSSANFLFDAVRPSKRARCLAYYNILVNTGILVGSTMGGLLAWSLPRTYELFGHSVTLSSGIVALFVVSAVVRAVVVSLLLPRVHEERDVARPSWRAMIHVVGLSAIRGMRFNVWNTERREREPAEHKSESESSD